MPSPPIQVFLTTIASQPVLRKRQEYILRILQTKKIPFTSYDLASDEDAKRLWKRKAPLDKQQLPGILVGGRYPGDFDAFEEAVEYDELDIFLRLKESWNVEVDEDHPAPAVKPVGVPGAVPVSQMTPEHHKPKFFHRNPESPLKPANKREGEFDISTELQGFGLQGVTVTDDDLRQLVEELGLNGDEATDMVKSLGGVSDADGNSKLESRTSESAKTSRQ
ncbi:SH3-binding, glutamic acid-rich protein-domain-containing protein [Phlebopus sp. FC_14]|nr:SH3-binding, glutamic acid-rich protein-domain-containing protein [Phlebopus sp. FC_14]